MVISNYDQLVNGTSAKPAFMIESELEKNATTEPATWPIMIESDGKMDHHKTSNMANNDRIRWKNGPPQNQHSVES